MSCLNEPISTTSLPEPVTCQPWSASRIPSLEHEQNVNPSSPSSQLHPEPELEPDLGLNSTRHNDPSPPTNMHKMLTRSKIGNLKPKVRLANLVDYEPKTVKDALSSSHWKQAMQEEYNALMKNNTWCLVDPPSGGNVVGCKWVFKVKRNADGSVQRYKARLVAKGYNQVPGFDFQETFSPVVKPATIRVVLALALSRG